MSAYVRLLPVHGIGEVRPGDDLGALLAEHADLADGDVLVVAQKIVSKAEGRLVDVAPGEEPAAARRRLARAEARRVVADTPWVLITETPHGHVCANGGVDASNVAGGQLALLPADPDASARRLRAGLAALGAHVGVIVADTFGRPWRLGQTDVAIGVAGLPPLRDERGGEDRFGQRLAVTEPALADALAAAADLARRKADGVPAVIVRGLDVVTIEDGPGATALVRRPGEDLFRRGAGQLAVALAGIRGPAAATAAGAAETRPDAEGPDAARPDAARPAPAAAGEAAPAGRPAPPRDPATPVPDRPLPAWLVERALQAAGRARVTCTPLAGAPLRLAVEGDPLTAGFAAGLLVAAFVDGGAAAAPRLPAANEPGAVVVEAGWPDADTHD